MNKEHTGGRRYAHGVHASPPSLADAAVAVTNLIYRYAELIDHGDFDGLGRLLERAEVGAGDAEGALTGAEALTALFTATTRRYPDGTPGTKHVTTNVIVEWDEDGAHLRTRSYFTVLQAVDGLALQPIVAGRYHDRFASDGAEWHFVERRFYLDLVGDVSRHLLMELPASTE